MGGNNVKEWYNISEIAKILDYSRPTVYKKIDSIDIAILQSLQHKVKNITFYKYEIIDMLRDKSNIPPVDIEPRERASDIIEGSYRELYLESLRSQIEGLKAQVKDQSITIHDLNERLKELNEIIKNNQILQLRNPQDIKALKEHSPVVGKESLFKRIFRNKNTL